MDDNLKSEILRSIRDSGNIERILELPPSNIRINTSTDNHLLTRSSGLLRFKPNIIKQFHLILSTPDSLLQFSNLQIRCALCLKIISYPAWHYSVKFAINSFYYFVCFDPESPTKPTLKCAHGLQIRR